MQDLVKADIFFYITSVAIIVLTILLAVGLTYAILILKRTMNFVDKVKEEGEEMIDDLREFRAKLKVKGGIARKLPSLFSFIMKVSRMGRRSDGDE